MKKILIKAFSILMITICISFVMSKSVYAIEIPGSTDTNDYWGMISSCDQNDAYDTSCEPEIKLTFSEDGTKITKVETSGYYTNTSSDRLLTWSGMGFGIDETGTKYMNRWLFKGTAESDTLQSSPNYLDDAYLLYFFTSNNCYDKNTSFNNIVLEPQRGSIVKISGSYNLTDADNSKLDPNKTYYVNFILQGWKTSDSVRIRWGTLQSASFKINENSNYRYSASFNYNGHGGTNFTLPIKKNSSVSAAIVDSVDEKWTTEQKGIVANWQNVVSEPMEVGFIFGGWYEDEGLTVSANFSKEFKDETNYGNRTYYAKWTQIPDTTIVNGSDNNEVSLEVKADTQATITKIINKVVSFETFNGKLGGHPTSPSIESVLGNDGYIKVDLKSVSYDTAAQSITSISKVITYVFDVTAFDSSNIQQHLLSSDVTFRIPVVLSGYNRANVYHGATFIGQAEVKENSYIEVTAKDFSEYSYTLIKTENVVIDDGESTTYVAPNTGVGTATNNIPIKTIGLISLFMLASIAFIKKTKTK